MKLNFFLTPFFQKQKLNYQKEKGNFTFNQEKKKKGAKQVEIWRLQIFCKAKALFVS